MSSAPTTQLSLRHLRDLGYVAEVVERWVPSPGGQIKRDFLGFIDIIAVGNGETIGVQTTTKAKLPGRARKVEASEHLGVLLGAGWRVIVHGWHQPGGPRTRWLVDEYEVENPDG